jgi:hypothetical protein
VALRQPRRSRDPDLHGLDSQIQIQESSVPATATAGAAAALALDRGDWRDPTPSATDKKADTDQHARAHGSSDSQLPESVYFRRICSTASPSRKPACARCASVHIPVSVSVSAALGPRDLMLSVSPSTDLGPRAYRKRDPSRCNLVLRARPFRTSRIPPLRQMNELISVSCDYHWQGVRR